MSEPNVIHVQGLYAAFGRGDLDYIARACTPDATWEIVGQAQAFPTFGTRIGPTGVLEFFHAHSAAKTLIEFTPQTFHAAGDRVFVEGHEVSVVQSSGRQVETPWLHIFTFRDGEVVAFREFTDTAQFVGAANG